MVLELRTVRGYRTTLDRSGLALGVGGVLGGVFALVLALAGGTRSPIGLATMLVGGSFVTTTLIVATAGPLWLLCHVLRWRGPVAAALVGALAGFVLFLAGQTYGFGLYAMPATDPRTLLFRWLSGAATSVPIALVAAGIGLIMWRVAYRRVA